MNKYAKTGLNTVHLLPLIISIELNSWEILDGYEEALRFTALR